jgi:hypothetical protein
VLSITRNKTCAHKDDGKTKSDAILKSNRSVSHPATRHGKTESRKKSTATWQDSFPASDPPGWTSGVDRRK